MVRKRGKARAGKGLFNPPATLLAIHATQLQGESDIAGNGTAKHYRALKHHRLPQPGCFTHRTAPANGASRGPDQAVAKAQEQAFAGAIWAKNYRARSRRQCRADTIDQRLATMRISQAFQPERKDRWGGFIPWQRGHQWRPVRSRSTKARPFTISDSVIRMMPRPSDSARSPLEV